MAQNLKWKVNAFLLRECDGEREFCLLSENIALFVLKIRYTDVHYQYLEIFDSNNFVIITTDHVVLFSI